MPETPGLILPRLLALLLLWFSHHLGTVHLPMEKTLSTMTDKMSESSGKERYSASCIASSRMPSRS